MKIGEAVIQGEDSSRHSVMLSQIASAVDDWVIDEECTTLDAVKLLLADARKWRGLAERLELELKYVKLWNVRSR